MTHWTTDDAQVKNFVRGAGGQGYTPEEALQALGVEKITDLRGGLGTVLNELQKVKKGKRAQSALAVLPPDQQRALYPTDALFEFGRAVRSFAPWANDDNHPMSDAEVALVVQRGAKCGLDVLNPHEVQIWKDNKGIKFQMSYSLMAQWASVTLGGHTQPRYREMTAEERESHGVKENDRVIICEFVMRSDIPFLKTMIEAGWEPVEARADITMVGVGTVSASDWGGKYFAPNARSKRWKLEKRAYIDALRRRYGTPSEADILSLRRARGDDVISVEDWAIAKDETDPDAMTRHARESANGNGTPEVETRTPDEILAHGNDLLHGDGSDILDGEVETVEEPVEQSQPEPEPEASEPGAFASADAAITWAMTQNVFDHANHARNSYDKCKTENTPKDAAEMARYWCAKVDAKVRVKEAHEYEHDGRPLSDWGLTELSNLLTQCDEGMHAPELAQQVIVMIEYLNG